MSTRREPSNSDAQGAVSELPTRFPSRTVSPGRFMIVSATPTLNRDDSQDWQYPKFPAGRRLIPRACRGGKFLHRCLTRCLVHGELRSQDIGSNLRSPDKLRNVAAGGQCDSKLGSISDAAIVLHEAFAHIAGRHPNDGVFTGIVGRCPAEKFDANRAFFQVCDLPDRRLPNYIFKKLGTSRASLKSRTFSDLVQISFQQCLALGRARHVGYLPLSRCMTEFGSRSHDLDIEC